MALMAVFFFYGIIRFPDSPIRPAADNSFVGKQGQPHTFSEYHDFKIWRNTLSYVWPVGIVVLFLLRKKR